MVFWGAQLAYMRSSLNVTGKRVTHVSERRTPKHHSKYIINS